MKDLRSQSNERSRRRNQPLQHHLTESIQASFGNIEETIPQSIVKNIDLAITNIGGTIEQLTLRLGNDPKAFDDNGTFKGWADPYVASQLCAALGLENRFFLSQNPLRQTSHHVATTLFGEGPYEEKDKAYIPPSIANMISFHNAIQRLGIAFALTTGISFGELLSEELLKTLHLQGIDAAKITSAIAVNLLVFGGSTKATEKFISETKNKPDYNQVKRLALLVLVVGFCKVPMVVFTGVAGSANSLNETDRTYYAQIQAQSKFEKASSKTEVAKRDLEEGGKLYLELKLLNSKQTKTSQELQQIASIKEAIDKANYPNIVSLYGEQLYIQHQKSVAESNRGQNDGSVAGINKEAQALDYLGLKYSNGEGFMPTGRGKYNQEQVKVKEEMKKFGAEYIEGTRPKLDFIRDAEIMKEDFAKLTSWQWLEKWLPKITSQEEASTIINQLKTVKLKELPASDQINLVKIKLHDEFNYGGKVPSFLAYVFIALLFEALSSLTLGLLYTHKDFAQKYANSEFQGGYANLTDIVKTELFQKITSSVKTESSSQGKVPPLTSNYGVYSTVIDQLMRGKPIPGINSIIEQYVTENYSKKYRQLKQKQDIEAKRVQGIDVRHPIVRACSAALHLIKK